MPELIDKKNLLDTTLNVDVSFFQEIERKICMHASKPIDNSDGADTGICLPVNGKRYSAREKTGDVTNLCGVTYTSSERKFASLLETSAVYGDDV